MGGLRGALAEPLQLYSETLTELSIEVGGTSGEFPRRVFDQLRAPLLQSLTLITPNDIEALPGVPGRLNLRSLTVCRATPRFLHWVRTKRCFATLQSLRLFNLQEEDVDVLVSYATEFAHLRVDLC